MQLTDNVFVLALETRYFGERRTWHLTAVETERGLLLVDVGGPGDADVLDRALRGEGFGFSDVDKVLLTHQDLDHLGCLHDVVERSGAEIVAHRNAAPYVAGERTLEKRPENDYPGVPVDLQLTDGERFRTLAGELEVVFTPGHSPGHIALYLEGPRILVSGDMLRSDGGFSGPKPSVTPDMETAWDSLERLAEFDVARTVCFHGGPVDAGTTEISDVYEAGPI